jgi:hypothetical protein
VKYALSWYQVNHTPAGRIVRANVLRSLDDGEVIDGKDVSLDIAPAVEVTEAVILEQLCTTFGVTDIQPVPLVSEAQPNPAAA